MDKSIYRLVHPTARRLAAERCLSAPDGYICKIQEPTRTLEANAALHAAISDVAKQIKWHGEQLDVEDWKRLLVSAWARVNHQPMKMVPALDGQGFDVIYRRTSTLTKREASDLIEYVRAWGTDQGVKWSGDAKQE